MKKKVSQGKKNRAAGSRFELKVRKDLESKGWIVDKWTNNVDLIFHEDSEKLRYIDGNLIPAKHKFRGMGIPMVMGTGFPDFIAFTKPGKYFLYVAEEEGYELSYPKEDFGNKGYSEIIGVEAKSNGYLDKIEKVKCKWLLNNNIFSEILIAKKGEKRGTIKYTKFKE